MDFDEQKKQTLDKLYKPDKSKKGHIDERLINLITLINKHPDYYTTSSCSGRISLFTDNASANKAEADWLYITHEKAEVNTILKVVQKEKLPASIVWFRQEGFILHACARNQESATNFLQFAQANGFKKTTLLSFAKRFIIEVVSTQRIDSPIASEGKLLVDEKYITFLTSLANEKLATTHQHIKRLEDSFKKKFLQ